MVKEEWKPVRGKEEYAEISNYGQVHYYAEKSKKYPDERWTYGSPTYDGYLNATIGGVVKGVHVWVYLTFVGDIPKGMEVNHLDENPKNNRLDNLNLLNHGDNVRYGTGIARKAAAQTNHPKKSKAVQALNPETLEVVMEFPSTQEAQRHGFKSSNVSKCCNGKLKKYKGLIWRFRKQITA